MLQNLVGYNKSLPLMHKVICELDTKISRYTKKYCYDVVVYPSNFIVLLCREKPSGLTNEELKSVFNRLKQSADVLNSRLFIVLVAQAKGWQFAKDLEFLEAGMLVELMQSLN